MADLNTGMKKHEMASLLRTSKKQPVNCAIGVDGATGAGLLLLDRMKGPKILEGELAKQFPKAKDTRFGTALVDVDTKPKEVRIEVNKPVSGLAKKLVKTVRGGGFNSVVLVLTGGVAVEACTEEGDDAGTISEDGALPGPPQPALDAAVLRPTLVALIGRIQLVADPARKLALAKLAAAATERVKERDLPRAQAAVVQLRAALDASGPVGAQVAVGAKVTYARARLAWLAARQKVASEIERLRGEIVASFQRYDFAAELSEAHRRFVTPVLESLDESLADKLDEATNASDPAARAKLVAEAHAIMQRYQAFLANEPVIAALDANPFMPLAIRSTFTATLTTLSQAVR